MQERLPDPGMVGPGEPRPAMPCRTPVRAHFGATLTAHLSISGPTIAPPTPVRATACLMATKSSGELETTTL